MAENVISVVAALIRDDLGRVLLVRKRGTAAFMQPGGKRDAGESDVALGVFDCPAANEPGFQVRAAVYAVDVEGAIAPRAEIDRMVWVDPRALPDLQLAPLTRDHVLPLARGYDSIERG
jgi:8-oxo-dGTP diphosphatase